MRTRMQQNFSRAAAHYEQHAHFQHGQTARVLDAARMLFPAQARVLDIGCGTGYFAALAREVAPAWQIWGLDCSPGMCQRAHTRLPVMQADATAIPLATGSVDGVVSSLCYQWVEPITEACAELARVLRPGGRAVIASLGPASLRELRSSAEAAELPLGLLALRTATDFYAALEAGGLSITYADTRMERRYYPNVSALLDSMRRIGAGNASGSARFLSPKRWAAMQHTYEQLRTPAGIPATWEHVFVVASRA